MPVAAAAAAVAGFQYYQRQWHCLDVFEPPRDLEYYAFVDVAVEPCFAGTEHHTC